MHDDTMILFAVRCRGGERGAGEIADAIETAISTYDVYADDYHWGIVDEMTAGDEFCSTVVHDALREAAARTRPGD